MRFSASEKLEIIQLVEGSDVSAKQTLLSLGVSRSSFYRWYKAFLELGVEGLESRKPVAKTFWNKIPEAEKQKVVDIALEKPELSSRELAWHITDSRGFFVSESSVYRILSEFDLIASPAWIVMEAADEFSQKTKRVNELWQTDFTYFHIVGWGWYYLSTILDDFSRYIIAWDLTTNMAAEDVKLTLDQAIARTGVSKVKVKHKPRLLSDNGPCYVSKELKTYLDGKGMDHTRGKPYHPQTQGKIERYHRTMKNIVKLKNYYLPWELEQELEEFVTYYNNERVHESIQNMTPADVFCGRNKEIQTARDMIKSMTLRNRKYINMGLGPLNQQAIMPADIRQSLS